jgi:hypothetical protein
VRPLSLRLLLRSAPLAGLLILAAPRAAQADERLTLSGSWTASPLIETWSLADWGPDCGAKPPSSGGGGGSVQIREQGGELSILGGGRAFSSAECWEQMPGMSRTSHSQSGNGRFWRTRCSNAAGDPRHAAVVTTLSATDSSISLSEIGEYQWAMQGSICKATASRTRSYSLVKRDGDTPPVASATAAPSASAPPEKTARPTPPPRERPTPTCVGPAGDPARLEVHPARKLLKAGERFTFHAQLLDAAGCPTGARPTWSIVKGPLAEKAAVDGGGVLSVAADSAEGKLELTATAFGKSVTVSVEVASPEHYDALLGSSGLNAEGEQDEPAVAVIATGTIGGRTAVAEDAAKERKYLFVGVVGLLSLAMAFVGLVIARRGRRAQVEGGPDSADAPPSSEATPAPEEVAPPPSRARPAPKTRAKGADRGKICPTCGERYPSDATFCGKDGTTLVLLN